MRLKISFFAIVSLFCWLSISPAFGVTLSVNDASGTAGQPLTVSILVDNPESIAGAAFTLQYSSALLVTVDSTFFDTFYEQFNSLDTTGQAVPEGSGYKFPLLDQAGSPVLDENDDPVFIPAQVVVDNQTYTQPLIDNPQTTDATVKHCIAAARCVPASVTDGNILFSLQVSLKSTASTGPYTIDIIPTTLNNTDAGYDAAGETIDLLIGSDLTQNIGSGAAFPILIDDLNYAVTGCTVTFTDTDDDADELSDRWEMDHFGDLTHDGTGDSDNDGYTDRQEHDNTTDPNDGTTAAGLAGYSACTDNRVADSLQTVVLTTSGVPMPGSTLTVDVNYNISGSQTSTGINVVVFYNSSKVTYTGYDQFVIGGAETVNQPEAGNVTDDAGNDDNDATTDKKFFMSWWSVSDSWPSVSLPAKLAELQFSINDGVSSGDGIVFNLMEDGHDVSFSACMQGLSLNAIDWTCDVDGNGVVDAFSDGILIVRYLLNFPLGGSTWINGAIAQGATRTDAAAIENYIQDGIASLSLDIDGNGNVDAFSDGILIVRYLLNFPLGGPTWINGAIAQGATRNNAATIESYINSISTSN